MANYKNRCFGFDSTHSHEGLNEIGSIPLSSSILSLAGTVSGLNPFRKIISSYDKWK